MSDQYRYERAFREFDRRNPHVYVQFKKLARKLKATGKSKYSARAMLDILRWHMDLDTLGTAKIRVSNGHAERFARKLMREDPWEFGAFFNTRPLLEEKATLPTAASCSGTGSP